MNLPLCPVDRLALEAQEDPAQKESCDYTPQHVWAVCLHDRLSYQACIVVVLKYCDFFFYFFGRKTD